MRAARRRPFLCEEYRRRHLRDRPNATGFRPTIGQSAGDVHTALRAEAMCTRQDEKGLVGRRLACARKPDCRLIAVVCRHCDFGHLYCSEECSAIARRQRRREANRRYAATEAGRAGNRRRQQRWRDRREGGEGGA